MRIIFHFARAFYRCVLRAHDFRPPRLVISQLYDRHYFLGGWKKKGNRWIIHRHRPDTRIGYQPLEGATPFTIPIGVARISHCAKEKRTTAICENIITVIDRQAIIRRKRKYTTRNKLWKVGIVMQSYVRW